MALRWRALLALIRRWSLRILTLRRSSLGILALRWSLLILLARHRTLLVPLVRCALFVAVLHAALTLTHLRTARAHLLMILALLIAAELAQQLLAQLVIRIAIAGTSFRMRLRVFMNDRLHPLLLIGREI